MASDGKSFAFMDYAALDTIADHVHVAFKNYTKKPRDFIYLTRSYFT